jgi:hypothetical protein
LPTIARPPSFTETCCTVTCCSPGQGWGHIADMAANAKCASSCCKVPRNDPSPLPLRPRPNPMSNMEELSLRRWNERFTLKEWVRSGSFWAALEMEHSVMRVSPKVIVVLGMAVAVTACFQTQPAMAISVELAKKCRDMAIKAHPYTLPGFKSGNAEGERSYFKDCVAKGGNMSADHQTTDPNRTGQGTAPGSIGPN